MRIDSEFKTLIPALSKTEREMLEESLVSEGCRDALVVWQEEGLLLDGHNRHEICERLGIEYDTREISMDSRESALDWIDRNQLGRRNLTPDGFKYILGRLYNRQKKEHGGAREASAQIEPLKTAERLAEEHGVSPATVKRAGEFAKAVERNPRLKQAVENGESVLQVKRELREQKRESKRDDNRQKAEQLGGVVTAPCDARFSTIVLDPPWDWGDEGDVNQLGRAKPDYATMSIAALMELPIPSLADNDAHIYCWVTNRSLPKVFGLLDAWGFRYIALLTWPKPSFGMGNYFRGQTEHVAFGVRGSMPLRRKDASTLLPPWARGKGHSAKPLEFLDFVESCSAGPYLEMFSRGNDRHGWTRWGADA